MVVVVEAARMLGVLGMLERESMNGSTRSRSSALCEATVCIDESEESDVPLSRRTSGPTAVLSPRVDDMAGRATGQAIGMRGD